MAIGKRLLGLGHSIDHLVTAPIYVRVKDRIPLVHDLYQAARQRLGGPLTLLAGEKLLESVNPGGTVVISMGFPIPGWLEGETDGPTGAAALGRILAIAFDITPVFICEDFMVDGMKRVVEASGLRVYGDIEMAKKMPLRAIVSDFPFDDAQAREASEHLLEKINPSAVICIERPAKNEKGVYHSGIGIDISPMVAKVDHLVNTARSRRVFTLGIGDHGGEIGMGLVKDIAAEKMNFGRECRCPCGAGCAVTTETDALVVASISNWGAYGVEACIAALLDAPEIFHDRATEERMLEATAASGFIDSTTGLSAPYFIEMIAACINLLRGGFYVTKYQKASEDWKGFQKKVLTWKENRQK
jgi:hypothetical protein